MAAEPTKTCKVQLDRLFDHSQLGYDESKESLFGEISERSKVSQPTTKSCRLSRVPAKLNNFVRDKLSGHCPGCRAPVKDGQKGVVCEECKAYWHYSCANVTQQEIDNLWKEEFLCEAHRLSPKVTPMMTNSKIGGEQVLVNIKINSYTLDKANKIKFKLDNMEFKTQIEEKDCHRQYTIKVNSVLYQILVENFGKFGDRLGVKPRRFDVDNTGENTQDQYEMSLCNRFPVSVTYFHTTNKIMVQLKAVKDLKGADKAAKTSERILLLRDFVNNKLAVLIEEINNDMRFDTLKVQMISNLNRMLEECSHRQGGCNSVSCSPCKLDLGKNLVEVKQSPLETAEAENNSSNGAISPRKSPGRKKRCNDDCDKLRVGLNLRVSTLEKEKLSLQQKCDTLEKHQESLRSTITSKDSLISSQTQIIADHTKTISSQKQLINDMEIKSATHTELATSFLDALVSEGSDDCEDSEVDEGSLLQHMHNKIKELQTQMSASIAKVADVETERDNLQTTVNDLKQKLGTKTKEYSGLKTQLCSVEKSVLSKEKELKDIQSKLADSIAGNESLRVENAKLGAMLANAESKVNELSEETQAPETELKNTKMLLDQMNGQLKEKDNKINDQKETIEFIEAAKNDAKRQWKEETSAAKRLQGLLNGEKQLRVKAEEECCLLQTQLTEVKVKFERYRSLNKLNIINSVKEIPRDENATVDHSHINEEVSTPEVMDEQAMQTNKKSGAAQHPCIFELRNEGACLRKDKCKFNHALASSLRDDPIAVSDILSDMSAHTGKCAFEMTQRGSCPGESICKSQHNVNQIVPDKQGNLRRICFRELVKKGSCGWGDGKCRFSHKITEQERTDESFVLAKQREKDEKASMCIYEFQGKGFCKRKDHCSFSHKISDQDRNNEVIKKSTLEKIDNLKKKKVDLSTSNEELSMENPNEFYKGMLILKKEFLKLMEQMKAQVSP